MTQVSVATVAAYINAGGLGDIIFQGITQDFGEKVVVGAVLTSLAGDRCDETLRRIETADCARLRRSHRCLAETAGCSAEHQRVLRRWRRCSHLWLAAAALAAVLLIALPLGIVLTRAAGQLGPERVIGMANVLRTMPAARAAGAHAAAARDRVSCRRWSR